jgi:arginyl-tRNA synthetase
VIVTANEVTEYFHVVLKALELIMPEAAKVTQHVPHGMLRFADGKMSSRKGNVITGESLLGDIESLAQEKLKERDMDEDAKKEAAEIVSVAAIKYSILKQIASSDIVFDMQKSISFEGDSGPYLLYTAVRANSVLEKAKKEKIKARVGRVEKASDIERQITRFPEVVTHAAVEKSPHFVATYLVALASSFNAWYANTPIVRKDDPDSPHKIAVTEAVHTILENGLKLLGMKIPERM